VTVEQCTKIDSKRFEGMVKKSKIWRSICSSLHSDLKIYLYLLGKVCFSCLVSMLLSFISLLYH